MVVYMDEKPKSCDNCPCYVPESHDCDLFKKRSYSAKGLYETCEIRELRPKPLKWRKCNYHGFRAVYLESNTPIGYYNICERTVHVRVPNERPRVENEYLVRTPKYGKTILMEKGTLDGAKAFCQKHYEGLFLRMIGGFSEESDNE